MKVLLLFIYSEDAYYRQMMDIQKKYIHKFDNVESYFIQMREIQINEIEIENDIIFVKGEEKLLNILYKTIMSLDYLFKNNNYDYVIRTNISTMINIPKLLVYLSNLNPKNSIYTGASFYWNLQWIDEKSGIMDKTLWGTNFIGGTSITLSGDVVNFILKNKEKIRFDIVDDVSIGIFIANYFKEAFENGGKNLSRILYTNINKKEEIINNFQHYEFYRNWNLERKDDIIRMDLLYNLLYV